MAVNYSTIVDFSAIIIHNQFFLKKWLTFCCKGDIIDKPSEIRQTKAKKSQKSSKNFEKSFKNLLTSSRKCDIINKLSERKSPLERFDEKV